MNPLQEIFDAITAEGFSARVVALIDNYINDILYGKTSFPRFNLSEHAGLCSAGAPLIGASIVACYARASLEASSNVTSGEGSRPSNYWSSERRGLTGLDYPESRQKSAIANWEIDELQEQLIEQWARAANLWENDSEKILVEAFGPKIAEGAEAKVYYRSGDTCVVKERASIYSTTQKALEAIVLHNCLFPETTMRVIGFTRDSDHIFRIVLTQPYISCKRLASKEEIDELAFSKGFHDNWNGEGVNYISERIALEDMHPANVFIDDVTCKPICIDCIVKFVNSY